MVMAGTAPRYQNLARGMSPLDRVVFSTESVVAAKFRCALGDPRFRDSGPTSHYLVTFPRTSVWIRYAGGSSFVADPTLSTIYNPGQDFTRRELNPDGDRSDWLAVSAEVARAIAASVEPRTQDYPDRPFVRSAASVDRKLYLAQRRLFTRLEQGDIDPLDAEEQIISFVAAVIGSSHRDSQPCNELRTSEAHHDLVQRAKAEIAGTLGAQIDLSQLSARLRASPFHLCRVFRSVTGMTVHAYRTDLRLRVALERMSAPGADLSRVALDLGFSSHSHFSSVLRRQYGEAPSSIRRLIPDREFRTLR